MKDFKPYLLDTLNSIAKIKTYIKGYDLEKFAKDGRTILFTG
ncbi:MAG: hypothetical protein ACE5GU_15475 [Candidatus Scalinduaceae bacterium]